MRSVSSVQKSSSKRANLDCENDGDKRNRSFLVWMQGKNWQKSMNGN